MVSHDVKSSIEYEGAPFSSTATLTIQVGTLTLFIKPVWIFFDRMISNALSPGSSCPMAVIKWHSAPSIFKCAMRLKTAPPIFRRVSISSHKTAPNPSAFIVRSRFLCHLTCFLYHISLLLFAGICSAFSILQIPVLQNSVKSAYLKSEYAYCLFYVIIGRVLIKQCVLLRVL